MPGAEIRELRKRAAGDPPAALSGTLLADSEAAARRFADLTPLSNALVSLAAVTLTGRNDGAVFQTRTDRQGVFAWKKLPAGRYTLTVALPQGLSITDAVKGQYVPIEIPAAEGTGAACRELVLAAPDLRSSAPGPTSP